MKIGLRTGHSPNCGGAIGIVNEYEEMKKFYGYVKAVFEKYNHTVIDCNSNGTTASAELYEGAKKANNANCDLFISLHMNAFNKLANGSEVLVSSAKSTAYPYAKRLVDNYAELGFINRGVKFAKFYEMNHIKCGNLISEICFCDSKKDIDIYNKHSWEKLAYTLCNAVDPNIPKDPETKEEDVDRNKKRYIVTQYIKPSLNGYRGIDFDYIEELKEKYFKGVRVYVIGDKNGIWFETQYLTKDKYNRLKEDLGELFYDK